MCIRDRCYTCEVDLDEDEMARFLQDKFYNCPYYQLGDEDVYKRQPLRAADPGGTFSGKEKGTYRAGCV